MSDPPAERSSAAPTRFGQVTGTSGGSRCVTAAQRSTSVTHRHEPNALPTGSFYFKNEPQLCRKSSGITSEAGARLLHPVHAGKGFGMSDG